MLYYTQSVEAQDKTIDEKSKEKKLTCMKDPGVCWATHDLDFFHQLPVSAAWWNKNKKCPEQCILA